MIREDKENLYKLLRHHGDVLGMVRTTMIALRAFADSVRALKCEKTDLGSLYAEFTDVVKNSEPKIVPLLHLIEEFEIEMRRVSKLDFDSRREEAIRILEEKIDRYESSIERVVNNAVDYIQDNDVIVVHMASYIVTNVLVRARTKRDRKFQVVILQQHPVRAKQLINALSDAGIDHVVVPAYNLGHYFETSNKFMIAAGTITKDSKVLLPVGAASIVSSCHLNNIGVYLFADTLHFSRMTAAELGVHTQMEDVQHADCEYCLTSHSHDLVELDLFDHMITDYGEMDRETYKIFQGGWNPPLAGETMGSS